MEKTCGNCEHLKHSDMCGLKTAYCGMTEGDDFIVPHQAHLEHGKRGDDTVMMLTRIPMSCLREDVVKSEKPAPNKDWVKIIVSADS